MVEKNDFLFALFLNLLNGTSFASSFLYLFPKPRHFSLACRQEVNNRELCLLLSQKGRGQFLSLSLLEAGSVPGLIEGQRIIAPSRVLGPTLPGLILDIGLLGKAPAIPTAPTSSSQLTFYIDSIVTPLVAEELSYEMSC